jgi:hypothetical protein
MFVPNGYTIQWYKRFLEEFSRRGVRTEVFQSTLIFFPFILNGPHFKWIIIIIIKYFVKRIFCSNLKFPNESEYSLSSKWKNWISIYIISLFCPCVCLTGYRLGLWRSYRHEIGIIRTSMIWREDIGRKFSRKAASG